MIPPLMIGVICLVISMIAAVTPINGTFATDSKGVLTNLDSSYRILNVTEDGEFNHWIFGDVVTVHNSQVGNHSFQVRAVTTTSKQYFKVSVNGEDMRIYFVNLLVPADGYYGSVQFNGPDGGSNGMDMTNFLNPGNIKNGISTIPFSLGQYHNSTGQPVAYQFLASVSDNSGHGILYDIEHGYGYNMTISASNIQSSGAAGSILDANGFIAIFIGAAVIGGIAAITIFGSKIDFFGQKLIFVSATYIVIWFVLSVYMNNYIIAIPVVGAAIWLSLTAMYFLGLVSEMLHGEESVG